ncbi:FHA domain-containing protein [Actinomyces viscosus]|uniref:Uncharacterized protein n=1 Tax=Actinomyces viscosus TaxID=1656 RepID=A0A3S4V320_ACTVI|nr:FHA domain-containing protein [Actinomyces viscosus]TFH52638.1 FHA domain-containing protein [Actinomyces viscosus]VEI16840.1 Uncharacterised protein [Actinomyces viscosus]
MTASPLPGERVPLPEGLTRLSDGSLRADGVDGVAVIGPAAVAASRTVSVEAGLRVLEALGGTHLPRVGPTAPTAPATAAGEALTTASTTARRPGLRPVAAEEAFDAAEVVPGEPGDETTLLRPVALVTELPHDRDASLTLPGTEDAADTAGADGAGNADSVGNSVGSADSAGSAAGVVSVAGTADLIGGRSTEASGGPSQEEDESAPVAEPVSEPASESAAPSLAESSPEIPETGVWEDPDDSPEPVGEGREDTGADDSDTDTDGIDTFPDYPEPEPGSGRRPRGAHRAPSAPSASSGSRPTADTPTAPDNSKSKQPQPVRAPQPLEALPNTEVVSASEAALIAAPPVRASICPQGHANPPEIRDCLTCSQPLAGVFSYVRRPALATLTLSTGAAVEVAGDVVVGRAPQLQRGGDPHIVALVAVPSPQHMVSRSHLMLTTSGWSILVQDLGSSNGTVLARPGATPVLLGSGILTPVFMGDLMDIGDGVTLRIDPPAWLRPRSG